MVCQFDMATSAPRFSSSLRFMAGRLTISRSTLSEDRKMYAIPYVTHHMARVARRPGSRRSGRDGRLGSLARAVRPLGPRPSRPYRGGAPPAVRDERGDTGSYRRTAWRRPHRGWVDFSNAGVGPEPLLRRKRGAPAGRSAAHW